MCDAHTFYRIRAALHVAAAVAAATAAVGGEEGCPAAVSAPGVSPRASRATNVPAVETTAALVVVAPSEAAVMPCC